MSRGAGDRRAVSPVVGIALLVGIVVALATVSSGLLLGLTEEPEPSPDVTFSLEAAGVPGTYVVVHESGDRVDGSRIELRGASAPETMRESALSAGARHPVLAVDETIEVAWYGDDGTSYVIWEFDVQRDADPGRNALPGVDTETTVPEPDEGCEWVESESDGGTESVKIDGLTVDCDVETAKVIEVQAGGVVLGETVSGSDEVDADDARFYGDVEVADVFNLQVGVVTGDVTSDTADAKLDDATIGGSVTATKVVEVTGESFVGGDAVSDDKQVKVVDSEVAGSVAGGGSVKLDGADVDGHVYVDDADFDCTDSTVNGRECGEYTPKDPDAY